MARFWKSTSRWLPGVILSLVAMAAILYFVNLQRFWLALRSANLLLLLIYALGSLVWLALRGIVWRTLLRERASYRDVFLTLSEGYLLNNFLPFRLGEIGRAFLLGRKANLGFLDVLSTIVLERVVDVAFSAAILIASVPFVVGAARAGQIAILVGVLVVLGLVILYLLARNRVWAMGLYTRLTVRWPRLQKGGQDFLTPLFSGLTVMTNPWLFLRFLFWMTLDWALGIFMFYVLLLAFFPHPGLLWVLFGLGAQAFGNAIPSLPGAIGTYEAAVAGALVLVSHDKATSLALAVTAHLFSYFITGIIGLYALVNEGETVLGVYRRLRRRQEEKNAV
jgi:hypothetical protein